MQNHAFDIKPSRQYRLLLGAVCLSALITVFAMPLPFLLKLLLAIAVLFYGKYCARLVFTSIQRTPKGNWLLTDQSGYQIEAALLGDSTITTWVSVLRFKVPHLQFPQNCLVFRDSLAAGQYRALMVVLQA